MNQVLQGNEAFFYGKAEETTDFGSCAISAHKIAIAEFSTSTPVYE
jgi:hypothetical protein